MKLYESGATFVVKMGVFVSKMRDSIEAHIENGPGSGRRTVPSVS